jgi:predicted RNA-binding Zn ribbon-like protein
MDFGHYAQSAVDLVNADLSSLEATREHLAGRDWLLERLAAADLRALRRLQQALAAVVDSSAAGDGPEVVAAINDLMSRHPVRPRISGHDRQSWHLHVNGRDAAVAEVLAAETLFGLALVVTELGPDRLGRCAAEDCDQAFLDTSTNASKRFCSTRCATRTNVAAYRQRRHATSS